MHRLLASVLVFCLVVVAGWAMPDGPDSLAKKIAKASDDPLKTLKRLQLPVGLEAELWAAEPMLVNPIAFAFDERGRIYVAESFRVGAGVTDNRGHMKWLDEDLANRTVAQRVEMYKRHKFNPTTLSDRIRLLSSSKGTGKPDTATIFADGFNRPEDGLGAGVLAHRGTVYFTCIPDLWLLKDTTGDGRADVKQSLHTGYGVHVAFLGHDSHGLKIGPDGRLYFSIGDRGLNVHTDGRDVQSIDSGAVLRCNLDGSDLELVHVGLRNPQELAFDKFGNLFTADNNADQGDLARVTQIVEGGDSGWRLGQQYLPKLGIWNSEATWQPNHPLRSAYFLPPIGNLASGPSGLTYHPGVARLPDKYHDHFFLCDFRGGSSGSTIHSFQLKPAGASFEIADRTDFVRGILATDCDFGPDGGFYMLDWVEGWGLTGKGRIFRVADTGDASPKVAETQKLIAALPDGRPVAELAKLLAHDDMRVRLAAQFELADRKAIAELTAAARMSPSLLARLHGIWGLGQLGRTTPAVLEPVVPLLADPEAEVRVSAARVLGDARHAAALDGLVARLKDESPRVRAAAAQAVGRIGDVDRLSALMELLRDNADGDAAIRDAAVTALARLKDVAPRLARSAADPNASVRLGATLALRKLGRPEIAAFLNDRDPRIVLEAARGVYDTPIDAAMPKLAELLDRVIPDDKTLPASVAEPILRRAAAAHFRLGEPANAAALARFAGRATVPEEVRLESLKHLQGWIKPSGRDPIVGVWRPLATRPRESVVEAVRGALPSLMTASDKIGTEAAKLAAEHGIGEIGPALRAVVVDSSKPTADRLETLTALETLRDRGLSEIAVVLAKDGDGRLRHRARRIRLAAAEPIAIVKELSGVLDSGSMAEKQGAFAWLADLKHADADALIGQWLERFDKTPPPVEVRLDVLEAARRRADNPALKKSLANLAANRPRGDDLAPFRETLAGGDAEAGRKLFLDRTDLACLRCHKIQGAGGDVGPDLTGLGKRVQRDYILESIVLPNKQIAKGYETVVLVLGNGQVRTGILKSESPTEVRLMNAEGQILVVPQGDIDERNRGPSSMPADLIHKMSPRELRDLVEFLSGL